ncbi:MAG: metallophosphoesterase [Bacteroidota bacterium]
MTQPWMFAVFFIVVCSLFGLTQYRLFRLFRVWIAAAFHEARRRVWLKAGRAVLLGFNILFALQFVLRISSVYDAPLVQSLFIYPSGLFFATVVLSFLIVSMTDIVRLLLRLGRRLAGAHPVTKEDTGIPLDEERRKFLMRSGLTTVAALGSFPIVASLATARDYQLNRIELKLQGFPSELNGMTLVQISDIHSGIYMTEENMKEIIDLANSLHPTIVMVTGDFVDSSDSQIEPLSNALKDLKAELAVYGCLGNHDHFATASRVTAAVQERGVVMLNNSHEKMILNNRMITVVGIDDAGHGAANFGSFDEALNGVDPESFKIMLTHRPAAWDECRTRGLNLTLAGHTHGGQVGFQIGPLNLNPVYLVHKYAMGLYEEEEKYLYVNVGVGMVGVPIRMVRPEIAAITLISA